MIQYFNIAAFKNLAREIQIAPTGFRYGFIQGVFHTRVYEQLIKTFPPLGLFTFQNKPSGGGYKRFYSGPYYYSGEHLGCLCHLDNLAPIWKAVIHESASTEFIELLRSTTQIQLNSFCMFGFSYGKEGCSQTPHVDGAVRPDDPSPIHSTIASFLYFNEQPGGPGGTTLYFPDHKTVLFQVPDLRNAFFFFEQHPASWHGFPPLPKGTERRLVSLTYSFEPKPIDLKTSVMHRLTCLRKPKKLARKMLSKILS